MFELHVDVACLALLLTGGASFFLTDPLLKLHLQSGYLGWKTDDLLLETADGLGRTRKVAIQVKRAFSMGVNDTECAATFRNAFLDFRNAQLFNPACDRLGLVVSVLPDQTARGLRSLLDCARAALSFEDMLSRLRVPAYLGKPVLKYCESICEILRGISGPPPKDQEIWQFLRVFDCVSLDLGTPGSTIETLIKSLIASAMLSSTTTADETWNELLAIASKSVGAAGSFDRNTLPAHLRERFRHSTGEYNAGLSRLAEDTAIVAKNVKTTIAGKIELPRRELVAKLCGLLNQNQIVLVTGDAGSGKSGLAKLVFELLCETEFGVAMRAESLAGPHLNQSFFPHDLTLSKLTAYFALHDRKIIWVESVERLLEKDDRAAFRDLLLAVKAEPSWKLLVTCRAYSAETVRSAFFGDLGLVSAQLHVPELEDNELDEVGAAIPSLARPLLNHGLRRLLKKPFLLDKAAQMQWSPKTPLPQDEREFRSKIWREVIRREDEASGGMPQLRAATFLEVALRRARALEPFISGDDLNPDALFRLRRDSLITSPESGELRLAPAHDVLEDWALLQWLQSEFQKCARDFRQFFTRIGTYPALRRAYRKWLRESLDAVPQDADALVIEVICDLTVPVHWREDTLTGVLLSRQAADFLKRNASILLRDGGKLFRQVIHLLRVACKAGVSRIELGISGEGEVFLPIGNAWQAAAELMEQGLSLFADGDAQFILGFLEDWALITRCGIRNPKGSRSVAKVVLYWLPKFTSWRSHDREVRERLLKILLWTPRAAEEDLRKMVGDLLAEGRHSRDERKLLELIFSHFNGDVVCRDMPDLTVRVAEHLLEMDQTGSPKARRRELFESRKLEAAFGFESRLGLDDFPPSAYHGPYLRLLWHHPALGLEFVVRLLNHCCDAYGDPQNRVEFVELPERAVIELPDGTTREQWGNSRLWGLYRSATVGPYALQCALMALERWLLDKAERNDADLQEILTSLLAKSNNVAITAVVASIAMAHPYKVADAGYSVLTCRHFFDADLRRMVHESPGANISGGLNLLGAEKDLYGEERHASDQLPHRRRNLQQLAVMLQTTPLRERIWALFARFKAALPAESEQDEPTRIWRLQLHNMDIRNFIASPETEDGRVMYQPADPPPDLQRIRDEARPRHEAHEAIFGLLMWGLAVFEGNKAEIERTEIWREKLLAAQMQRARTDSADDDSLRLAGNSCPAFVAAVCIRDHWEDLSNSEKGWCATVICDAIEADAETRDYFTVGARNRMDGSRPAAFILPSLFGKELPGNIEARLLPTLAKAVGHAVEEVVRYLMLGIGSYLELVPNAESKAGPLWGLREANLKPLGLGLGPKNACYNSLLEGATPGRGRRRLGPDQVQLAPV